MGGEHGEKGGWASVWVSEKHGHGCECLESEVDGESVALQCGKLGARENFEGDDAVDEGLEEG